MIKFTISCPVRQILFMKLKVIYPVYLITTVRGGAMVLGKLTAPGRPANLD